jgi:adenylate cyclase
MIIPMPGDESGVGRMLQASRSACIAEEFFSATAHVPTVIALAILLARPYAAWPLVVPLLAGAFLQAWLIGGAVHAARRPHLALQLVGSGLFAATLASSSWGSWLADPFLWIYLGSSGLVACCQGAGRHLRGLAADASQVGEHVVRVLAVIAVYAAVDAVSVGIFFSDPGHRFLVAGIALFGIAQGASAVVRGRDRSRLAEVTARLRGYSELLLGRSRLTKAMGRDDDMRPRRTRRSVLFADIRGFTKWSEAHSPEEVLLMLDGVYSAAEHACAEFKPARTKHTGDEVMMFFAEPMAAAQAAMALRDEVGAFLALYGLHVGIGVHHGEVIEGLVGASRTKAYDILGDTVNTAKRVSDHAKAGSIIVTFTFFEACRGRIDIAGDQKFNAKGKTSVILVAELVGVQAAAAAEGCALPPLSQEPG